MRPENKTVRPPGGTSQIKPSVGLFGRNMHLCTDYYGYNKMAINVKAAPCVNRMLQNPILFGFIPCIAVRHGKGKK